MGFNCTFCKGLGAKFVEDSSTFVDSTYKNGKSCNWTNCSNFAILTKHKNISFPKHNGCLSIKYPLKGIEHYEIESGKSIKIDLSNFLILNSHQNYTSEFYSGLDNEVLCIFFQEQFVKRMISSAFQNTNELLDNVECFNTRVDFIFDTLHKKSANMDNLMQWFRSYLVSSTNEYFGLQQKFVELFYQVLSLNSNLVKQRSRLRYQKKSTRDEIYYRLQKGREYIESNFTEKINLENVANASNLSQFHFLRKFKELFGISPHYYLLKKRINYAAHLIKNNSTIVEACYSSGFTDTAHFSKVFKQIKRKSPRAFRVHSQKKQF